MSYENWKKHFCNTFDKISDNIFKCLTTHQNTLNKGHEQTISKSKKTANKHMNNIPALYKSMQIKTK